MKPLIAILTLSLSLNAQSLKVSRAVLYGGIVADLASTRYAISKGGIESNPLGRNPLHQFAINAGYGIGMDLLLTRLVHRHPQFNRRLMLAIGGAKLGIAACNVQIGLRIGGKR